MPFDATTYRVFIASPADMVDERQAVTDAVHEWNVQHATAEGVVLLPIKWETHAVPQSGVSRAQFAINAQLVGQCDILVGMFWTKLGSDAGIGSSGTQEEIDQFVGARKPALVYFSKRCVNPYQFDPNEFQKVSDYKKAIQGKALTGEFCSPEQLKSLVLVHLLRLVRDLISHAGRTGRAAAGHSPAEGATEAPASPSGTRMVRTSMGDYCEEAGRMRLFDTQSHAWHYLVNHITEGKPAVARATMITYACTTAWNLLMAVLGRLAEPCGAHDVTVYIGREDRAKCLFGLHQQVRIRGFMQRVRNDPSEQQRCRLQVLAYSPPPSINASLITFDDGTEILTLGWYLLLERHDTPGVPGYRDPAATDEDEPIGGTQVMAHNVPAVVVWSNAPQYEILRPMFDDLLANLKLTATSVYP